MGKLLIKALLSISIFNNNSNPKLYTEFNHVKKLYIKVRIKFAFRIENKINIQPVFVFRLVPAFFLAFLPAPPPALNNVLA